METCNALEILKNHHLRVTKQRQQLLDAIIHYNGVFTVAGLLDQVATRSQDVATVYRFLQTLTELQIIREVGEIDRVMHFEMACRHHPEHAHFRCESCHRITCLDPLTFGDALQLLEQAPGRKVRHVSVMLDGICETCSQKEKK
jgi:Fur family transcriptional regulator, ferric uptake regulator